MRESRCTDATPIRAVRAVPVRCTSMLEYVIGRVCVRNKVDAHFAFWCLNSSVRFACWHRESLAKKLSDIIRFSCTYHTMCFPTCLEVVNQRFHALLHGCTRRRHQLVIINLDCSRRHLVQALQIKTCMNTTCRRSHAAF